MTSREIRQKYLDFFKSRGHAVIESASLIPENDPSTLFTSSGMQPLVPYLLGQKHPLGTRLCDSQKCVRLGDIEEVGDNRHNTFFEMLGNWSLGDYFKQEQLNWFFEFLTQELKLDPRRLYVSVFRGNEKIGVAKDETSAKIWQEIFAKAGIEVKENDRIFYYPDRKNWWSRSGMPAEMPVDEIGGPDSEVFYDFGADLKRHENSPWKNEPCHINCDCGRFIEIGNSVFIEFIKTGKGFDPLPQKNVDFGGGLERFTMVTQDTDDVFKTDLFSNLIDKVGYLSGGKKYIDCVKEFRVIADHLKGASFLMGDDKRIAPSNTDQGYIIRRLIRRAIRYGQQLGIKENLWTGKIAEIVISDYQDVYPELERNKDFVLGEMEKEEEKFNRTLEKGMRQFETFAQGDLSGEAAFNLYQSYGFPIEMTKELAQEKGLKVDEEGFKGELKKHQELSRTAAAGKFKSGLADHSEQTIKYHTVAHLLLAALRRVLGGHVEQKGSNITSERVRFDFSHTAKMTDEQKQKVEELVNGAIEKDLPVSCVEMSLEQAKAQGAMGVFEQKYGDKVKVYTIGKGNEVFSREICSGPHVERLGVLGRFKIVKEESSSAGVRRIKAVLE